MSVQTSFVAKAYIHTVDLMSGESDKKKLDAYWNAVNSTLVVIKIQLVQKALDKFTKYSFVEPI